MIRNSLLALAGVLALASCGPTETTAAPEATQAEAVPEVASGPRATDAPDTWVQGKVFRVWPYGNGELMGYLGKKDGIRTGDTLALEREGVLINRVEVLEVREDTFYGRVADRRNAGAWPKVGDIAVKIPVTN